MSGREIVEQWLFEYCCRHHYTQAIAEIANKHNSVWSANNCSIPSIYVLLTFMREVVESQQISLYDVIIDELTRIADLCVDIVPFKVYARLNVALKVMVLFDMLRNDDKLVLPRLNRYFPRSGFKHVKADKDLAEKLNEGQKNFRTIFLQLIADKDRRSEYFRNRYETEYGVLFIARVKDLLYRFIDAIDGSLPPCAVDRLLGKNADQRLADELALACSPSFEMLLDAVNDKDSLTESAVIALLHTLLSKSPIDTIGLQQVIHSGLCTSDDSQKQMNVNEAPIESVSRRQRNLRCVLIDRHFLPKRQRFSDADMFCSNPVFDGRAGRLEQLAANGLCPLRDSKLYPRDPTTQQPVKSGGGSGQQHDERPADDSLGSAADQVDTVSSSMVDVDMATSQCLDALTSSERSSFETDVEHSPITRGTSTHSPGASRCMNNVSDLSSEETIISDSDLQSRFNAPACHLVPSSYSFDQYDVLLRDASSALYPKIEKHLRYSNVRQACVVWLQRNKKLDKFAGTKKMYS